MRPVLALGALAHPLGDESRAALHDTLVALLSWQRSLRRFPRAGAAPNATPIVSLYSQGRLCGCSASTEGRPRERVMRAFLHALGDLRFGGIEHGARGAAVAQIAYPIRLRRVSLDAAPRVVAPGAHGLALSDEQGLPTLLLPDVAREGSLDAEGLLCAMEHKAGRSRESWRSGGLLMFETDRVIARLARGRARPAGMDPVEAGVRWLSARVASDGAVSFGLDPRAERDEPSGPMLHGRAAVVAQALATHASGSSAARRARRWLDGRIQKALSGVSIDGWPTEAPLVAGTLALARLAGLAVDTPLRQLAQRRDVAAVPWHAGQVACALGRQAPDSLWRACVRSLDQDPRAPWIAMAASRREDWSVLERVATALAASVREHGPHRGGVGTGPVPELALTAITVEALAPARAEPVRRARRMAREFLHQSQLLTDAPPETRDEGRVRGAFPLTPVHGFLRCDVTAHAVLGMATSGGE